MEKKNNSSKGIKAFLKSRKARHGSLAVVLVIAAVALVVVLNIVVGLLVERFPNLKMDLTSNSAYALSDDAEDFMSHLDKDVNMYRICIIEFFNTTFYHFNTCNFAILNS